MKATIEASSQGWYITTCAQRGWVQGAGTAQNIQTWTSFLCEKYTFLLNKVVSSKALQSYKEDSSLCLALTDI